MTYVALFLFGIVVGGLSGLLGIGGGIVLVPGLMLLFGLTQHEAQGTSLTVLSLPILAFAAVVYYRQGHVQLPIAGVVACGFVIGAFAGAKALAYVPPSVLRSVFGGLLLYVGLLFALGDRISPAKAVFPAASSMAAIWFFRRKRIAPEASHSPPEYYV